MIKKILIIGVPNSLNNGNMAIVTATIDALEKEISNAEFTLLSDSPQSDRMRYKGYKFQIIEKPWFLKSNLKAITMMTSFLQSLLVLITHIFFATFRFPAKGFTRFNLFLRFDLIVDLGGESLSPYYGLAALYDGLYPLFLTLILKKPLVIYAQSVGPFKSRAMRRIIAFIINRASLITLRDKISMKYLNQARIFGRNVYLTTDPAFLLEPKCSPDIFRILKKANPNNNEIQLVGISASQLIHRYAFSDIYNKNEKHEKYIEFMRDLIQYILEEYNNVKILLIPHVVRPTQDDRLMHEMIFQKLSKDKQKRVIPLQKMYTADELKGIIGLCTTFIGCRMHSTIAAVSMHVPTIAISYGHKFHGVLGELLGKKLIIDIRRPNSKELLSKAKLAFDYIWVNRRVVRNELKEKITKIRKRALQNAKLVKKLLILTG